MNHVEFSRRGGKAGTGDAKVRGDSEHYAKLAKLPRKKQITELNRKRALAGKTAGNSSQRRAARRRAAK